VNVGLVDVVLGAAGWEAESVAVEGRLEPARARRYANARVTLQVAPLDGRRLVLFVEGRRPLVLNTTSADAANRDAAEAALRLLVEWQDRLGEAEADAAFWRALVTLGVHGLVLQEGRLRSDLDWSRLDARGEAHGGYLLACACQQLSGRPQDADPALLRVAGQVVREGWSEIFCECTRCGRRWKVEEDTAYHFPLWRWTDVTHCPEHAAHYDQTP
jgi:hypothetical protein